MKPSVKVYRNTGFLQGEKERNQITTHFNFPEDSPQGSEENIDIPLLLLYTVTSYLRLFEENKMSGYRLNLYRVCLYFFGEKDKVSRANLGGGRYSSDDVAVSVLHPLSLQKAKELWKEYEALNVKLCLDEKVHHYLRIEKFDEDEGVYKNVSVTCIGGDVTIADVDGHDPIPSIR